VILLSVSVTEFAGTVLWEKEITGVLQNTAARP